MEQSQLISFALNLVFVISLGWYMITLLQWYDYKFVRVVTKHHKWWWHIIYFIVPFIAYYATGEYFWIFLIFAHLPALILWNKKLDKKLVLTWRVKRFLILLFTLTLFQNFLCTLKEACDVYGVFMPLLVAYGGSYMVELYLFTLYKKSASKKIQSMQNLKVIAITGSYGKTSMKNILAQILSKKYNVYATPRSVNTIGGIIRDVNESLPEETQIYICEAGAREFGDILTITQLLNPHYVVVGKVGPQHLEYFKNVENIIRTKLEIVHSDRLVKGFVHNSVTNEPRENISFFGDLISEVDSTLEGTDFTFQDEQFHTDILGSFQTINIEATLLLAQEFGFSMDELQNAVKKLEPIEHRLQRIEAGGKIILDDGYNGNVDGINEGIRLCALHNGRKVIVTPGLVEASDALNIEIIENINKVFDLVIVTGALNVAIFQKHLTLTNVIYLKEKTMLQTILGEQTYSGDLILFANDAPNFI